MDSIRKVISNTFLEALGEAGVQGASEVQLSDGMVLLASGLDSMGFAILVSQVEDALGYDPFVLMEEPVYPQTLGEFIAIYERFGDHREG